MSGITYLQRGIFKVLYKIRIDMLVTSSLDPMVRRTKFDVRLNERVRLETATANSIRNLGMSSQN